MKTKFFFISLMVCLSLSKLSAQCPSGETELTILVNAPFQFFSEIGWAVTPPVAGVNDDGCVVGVQLPPGSFASSGCFTNNTVYTFDIYDTFGDNWNGSDGGGMVTITITEDGSVNGMSALNGCPISVVVPGQTGSGITGPCTINESFTFSVNGNATQIVGCSTPGLLNYNPCVDPADDDGSCLFIPPPPPLAAIPGCTDDLLGAGHDGNYMGSGLSTHFGGIGPRILEDFVLPTDGTISQVAGQFFFRDPSFNQVPPTGEDFEIEIFGVTANGVSAGPTVLGPITLTNADYNSSLASGTVYNMSFDIPDTFLPAGTYWLSIAMLSPVNDAFWLIDANSNGWTGSLPFQTSSSSTTAFMPLWGNMVHSICFAPFVDCNVNAGTDATLSFCSAEMNANIIPSDGDAGGSFSPAMASGTGLFNPAVDASGIYTYTVTDPNDPTCFDTADITITVTQAPVCNMDCTSGPTATFDLATCSCIPDPGPITPGCTSMASPNFDPVANCDDGSCIIANAQCYVGSITVGTAGGNEGVCFETTYILTDGMGAVVASNTTGEFSMSDGAAYNTYYAISAFTYNMCALGFMTPTIPPTLAALDPTLNCGTLTAPFEVLLKDSNPVACSGDPNAELRVGFSGWYTNNNQRYILTDVNNSSGTILQINNTGVFPSAGLANGNYYVCAVNFPPAEAAIVDGSTGQTLSSIEDSCSSLSDPTSYLTDCTMVSVVTEPTVTILLPSDWCTGVSSFDLDVWATPPGGIWTDASGATISSFDPSIAGVGPFDLNYTYTDGNNCSGSASITLNIGDDCLAVGIPTTSEWGLLCLAIILLSILATNLQNKEREYLTMEE